MPRFFVTPDAIREGEATLTGEDAHHISYALRMAVGEEITLCDGEGFLYRCRLSGMDGTSVFATVLEKQADESELASKIYLYQGYPKGDKLELIVQKAVELGAYRIVPFESSRCIKRPKADKIQHTVTRQTKIAHEAAKQCGRAILPEVAAPISFDGMLAECKGHPLALFCYEGEGTEFIRERLASLSPEALPTSIAVVIGSEGGFSPEEAEKAKEAGLLMTGLGGRILRCETASLYALSVLSSFLEK